MRKDKEGRIVVDKNKRRPIVWGRGTPGKETGKEDRETELSCFDTSLDLAYCTYTVRVAKMLMRMQPMAKGGRK